MCWCGVCLVLGFLGLRDGLAVGFGCFVVCCGDLRWWCLEFADFTSCLGICSFLFVVCFGFWVWIVFGFYFVLCFSVFGFVGWMIWWFGSCVICCFYA